MYEVNPFGERRQDIRSGRIGAYIVASHFAEVTDEAFAEMSSNLCNYLPCDQEHDEIFDADALGRMKIEE